MRHQTARPHADGGWHYVSMSSRGGHPLGYCAYHEPHKTEAEARECYAKFQRDNVILDAGKYIGWTDCEAEGCGGPTKAYAGIKFNGYNQAALCSEHMTMEHAIAALHLNKPAGDSWVS